MKYAIFTIIGIAIIGAGIWATSSFGSDSTGGLHPFAPVTALTQQGDMSTETTRTSGSDGFYADPSGFSFTAPDGLKATAVQEPGAETIIVGKAQIYVTPYDEKPSAFNAARIRRDLPTLAMKNVHEFTIGDGGAAGGTNGGGAVEFDDPAGHQIWFAAAGQLFQISAPADQAGIADKIVATFTFQ